MTTLMLSSIDSRKCLNAYNSFCIHCNDHVRSRCMSTTVTMTKSLKVRGSANVNCNSSNCTALAHAVDPTAPKAEGVTITPARASPSPHVGGQDDNTVHFSLVAALHKWATQSSTQKLPICTVLDQNGRPAVSLTYGLLLSTLLI